MTLLGSSSAYIPGAVASADRRLFLKRRMGTLFEWVPLDQSNRGGNGRKNGDFERLSEQINCMVGLEKKFSVSSWSFLRRRYRSHHRWLFS
jgi:hypothetical protein